LGARIVSYPENFALHPRVAQVMANRVKMLAARCRSTGAAAETLAYAGLLEEGHSIRICGQDAGRGTFFHRHAVLHDQASGASTCRCKHIAERQPLPGHRLVLSEEAVLGFEYGYSTTDPSALVIWEGQFGDFVNGAQVIIDQFISSGEAKWGRLCGLAMFLPHGYEGQGPEHSSARLEALPAALRREQHAGVRAVHARADVSHDPPADPALLAQALIVMTPKSLLRHELSVSSLEDLANGEFANVIDEVDKITPANVRRVVLSSGKVYFDLLKARRAQSKDNSNTEVALVRVEQLYPFPVPEMEAVLAKYPNAREVVWCQEEPQNQGAWYQIRHRLATLVGSTNYCTQAALRPPRLQPASPRCTKRNSAASSKPL
jgi:2-oxoglutarate dehydrogenase E1 component